MQELPSLHGVPFDASTSAGQPAELPLHVSVTSHWLAAARQTVPVATNVSAGQADEVPVQLSATSHAPAAARHTVPAAAS